MSAPKTKTRSPFTLKEDITLQQLVVTFGQNWPAIAAALGTRNARQCRDRWRGYLRPDLTTHDWTREEDECLISQYRVVGPKWRLIARAVIGRSEIALKNRWQMLIKLAESRGTPEVVPLAVHIESARKDEHKQPVRQTIHMQPLIDEFTCINGELRDFFNSLHTSR